MIGGWDWGRKRVSRCTTGVRRRWRQWADLLREQAVVFTFDYLRDNPIRVTAALYDRLVWRGMPAQEQGNAEQAFVSCHRDLCRCAIRHDVDKRNDAGCGEIKIRQLATGGVHDLAEWH